MKKLASCKLGGTGSYQSFTLTLQYFNIQLFFCFKEAPIWLKDAN